MVNIYQILKIEYSDKTLEYQLIFNDYILAHNKSLRVIRDLQREIDTYINILNCGIKDKTNIFQIANVYFKNKYNFKNANSYLDCQLQVIINDVLKCKCYDQNFDMYNIEEIINKKLYVNNIDYDFKINSTKPRNVLIKVYCENR